MIRKKLVVICTALYKIRMMRILAIETSCDETALALVEAEGKEKPGFKILGSAVHSQIDVHKEYGGVFPTLAKREHIVNLVPVLAKVLKEAEVLKENPKALPKDKKEKIEKILERENGLVLPLLNFLEKYEKAELDAVAVTRGPGLEPALWVGINFAKALASAWDMPIMPANHIEGHMMSVLADTGAEIEFPAVALTISGGHTELVLARNWRDYVLLGATRDDAVGEAFDKAARILGLPYPGGPEISRLAEQARTDAEQTRKSTEIIPSKSAPIPRGSAFRLPRPMIDSGNYDFSFSGIKTAVLYMVREIPKMTEEIKKLIAREFEDAVAEVLVKKTKDALLEFNPKTLIVSGGVIANLYIRSAFEDTIKDFPETKLLFPQRHLSTDNAVMIGIAAAVRMFSGEAGVSADSEIKADGNLRLAGVS